MTLTAEELETLERLRTTPLRRAYIENSLRPAYRGDAAALDTLDEMLRKYAIEDLRQQADLVTARTRARNEAVTRAHARERIVDSYVASLAEGDFYGASLVRERHPESFL